MKNFKGSELLKKVYDNTAANLDQIYNDGFSFIICGNHGIGKSSIITNILKLASQKNYHCTYTTLNDAVNAIIDSPFDDKFLVKRELMECDFLAIDEFDYRFFSTENSADLFGRTLENIIRTRFSNKLPVMLCSNSPNPIEGFRGALKDSIESLFNKVKVFAVMGQDFRKTQGQ